MGQFLRGDKFRTAQKGDLHNGVHSMKKYDLSFYKYIFYCLYNFYQFEKDEIGKVYFVTFLITLVESFNISSLLILIRINQHWYYSSKPVSFIIFILVAAINLHIFAKNHEYKNIISDKNFKSAYSKPLFGRLLFLYYISSLILLLAGVYLDSTNGSWVPIQQFLKGIGF